MKYKNAFLIFNPNAGALLRGGTARLDRAIAAMRSRGHKVTPLATEGPCHATALASQAVAQSADLVLVAGGDGTLNEVLNGMVGYPAPLGLLPAGTANVLAMELGLGSDMVRIAEGLDSLRATRVSAGLLRAEGAAPRHFLLMAGAGLDASVVARVRPDVKRRLGKLAYWVAGWSVMGQRLPQLEVRINGSSFQTGFALASRVKNYGGDLSIARSVTLLRDYFEVVLFEGESTFPYIKYFGGVVTGTHGKLSGVHVVQTKRVDLVAPADAGIPVQIDGELAGRLPASVEIVHDALTLLLPPSYLER